MQYAERFQSLEVYRSARQLSNRIFELTKHFPREEMYSLTDQLRRSSRSVGAQVAEAWGKREYEKHFISKLTDAEAEQLETQHWIEIASDCGYLPAEAVDDLLSEYESIGRMLNSMILKAPMFCKKRTRSKPRLS